MIRAPAETEPPTFTAGEVERIFRDQGITAGQLAKWDGARIFRPSFYLDRGVLCSAEQHALNQQSRAPSRGDAHRRYTFQDLLWMRLFLHVKVAVQGLGARAPRLASTVIHELRKNDENPPANSRLLITGREVYLLGPGLVARCLTRPGELALRGLIEPSQLHAELRGRVHLLAANEELRDALRQATG